MAEQARSGNNPLKYFLIAFGFSWLFWIPATLINKDIFSSPWVILLYLGGLGPAFAAVLLKHLHTTPSVKRDYWSRVFGFRKISGFWYWVIFLSYPALSAITTFVMRGELRFSAAFRDILADPLRLVPFLIFLYLFGPFPEELGWRGYALDGLQDRMDPLSASLLLGFFHAIWHIPLFLMAGTYQAQLGFGSAEFWIFLGSATVVSVFYTWIYNNNHSSILSASLFHFSINLTGNVFFETQSTRLVRLLIMVVLIGLLSLATRRKGLLGFDRSRQLGLPASPGS
ncbi:MAG: CPBP family intramembrane glutamic endopeptidase [Anaerolineales bacterium]